MTSQTRNDELVKLLAPDFFGKNEPNSSVSHYASMIQQLCGLRGYYPGGAQTVVAGVTRARDISCGYGLAYTGEPYAGYLLSATQTGLPSWINFTAATTDYLTYGADDQQHDILGTEITIGANERGLTLGGWFKFTSVPLSNMGLMSKWYQAGATNQRAYHLTKNATNNIVFAVSVDGTAVVTVTSTGTVAADQWYHIYGRFDPSASVDVFIDNVKTSVVAGVPASIFDCTEPFHIGRYNRVSYLDGKGSNMHLNAAQLSDSIIETLWEQSRVMYGKEG